MIGRRPTWWLSLLAAVGLPFGLIYSASLNTRLVAADNAFRNFASLSFLIALLPIYWLLWRPAGRRIARLVGAAAITAVFGLAAFTFQVRPPLRRGSIGCRFAQ